MDCLKQLQTAKMQTHFVKQLKYMRWDCIWTIARDDATQTRLQYEDRIGNVYYLIANKTGNVCLKNFSDNELVMELISRGYKISR